MTIFRTLSVLAMVCLFAGSAFAGVIVIDGDGGDTTWRDDDSSIWIGQGRLDGGYDSSHRELAPVVVFELPDLGGEAISTANLMMHAWDSAWGSGISLDLYGVRWSSASAPAASDFYRGAWDVSGSNGTPIQQAYATKTQGNPAPANERNNDTDATGDAALAAWLTSVYTAGATAGDFVFLRVNPDQDYLAGSNSYIHFDSANATSVQSGGATYVQVPQLTIETVPEPASLGLIAIGSLMILRRK